jgi:hypothetical protein
MTLSIVSMLSVQMIYFLVVSMAGHDSCKFEFIPWMKFGVICFHKVKTITKSMKCSVCVSYIAVVKWHWIFIFLQFKLLRNNNQPFCFSIGFSHVSNVVTDRVLLDSCKI